MPRRRQPSQQKVLTVQEAISLLHEWGVNIAEAGLRYNLREGHLPGIFDGFRWWVRVADLRRFRLAFYD